MAGQIDKYTRRKARGTYLSTIIGMSLVLTMLGLTLWFTLSARTIHKQVKENMQVEVWLKESTKEVDIKEMEKLLKTEPYVKTADYICLLYTSGAADEN